MGQYTRSKIEEYEQQYNLCYLSIHPMIEEKGFLSSKKTLDPNQTVNIAVYDIHSRTTTYLFEKGLESETIVDFVFEERYDEARQVICYNDSAHFQKIGIRNNKKIVQRALANRVWVLTEQASASKKTYKLWSFEKKGSAKRLIAEFDENTFCRMDVWNQRIRLLKYGSDKVEIQDFEY
jgi:hypothetical protein